MHIPNWDSAVLSVKQTLEKNPELISKANKLGKIYEDQRGLMVVDCVASRQRRYASYVVPVLLPQYSSAAVDLSIHSLANKAPNWLPLREGEAKTMVQVAQALIKYGKHNSIEDENQICLQWANDGDEYVKLLEIKGIGPALLQYLRMLSGANTLKVDVRIIEELEKLNLPVSWFTTDGLLELCSALAKDSSCSLVELDQVLWHINGRKI